MPPRLARLLAVVVAVGLVVTAFLVRGALSDDDEDQVRAGPGPSPDGDASYRIVCDEDLGEACAALLETTGAEVEVRTADEVLSAETIDGIDAWLTLDPLPAMLDAAREVAGRDPATSAPLPVASSPVTLLRRGEVGCDDGVWDCAVDLADDRPLGLPAGATAFGIVAVGGATAAVVGPDINTRGTRALDDDIRRRLRGLTDSADRLDLEDQQEAFLTQPGRFAAVVTTGGLATAAVDGPRGDNLSAVPLVPEVTVGVVLVGLGSAGGEAVAALREGVTEQTVADALAEAGWDGDAFPSNGLPDPDVIDALREELG